MSSDMDYLEARKSSGEGGVVKQLKSQLSVLSQATKQRNDYMDEVKKVSSVAGVKARIAGIESTIKTSPMPSPAPSPSSNNQAWKFRSGSRTPSMSKDDPTMKDNNNSSKPSSAATSPRDAPAPKAAPASKEAPAPKAKVAVKSNEATEESEVKVIVSPSMGKMVVAPTEKEPASEPDSRLLKPSLVRRISYMDVTKKSFPSERPGINNSLVKKSSAESADSDNDE